MKKIDNITRLILVILTFIIFNIMIINEDSSWNIIPLIFSVIVFLLSFPSSLISKKIIELGNKINNKNLKIMYYVFLPIVLIVLSLIIIGLVTIISEQIPTPDDFASALGQALIILFIMVSIFIGIILPYVQTIITLILSKFIKEGSSK